MKINSKFFILFVVIILITGGVIAFYFVKNKTVAKNFLNVSGVVVPHHDLVAKERANFLADLSKKIKQPKTIILVSPNHYLAGRSDIQTTNKDWNLQEDRIEADKEIINFLVNNNLATSEIGSFADEHGIYNILQDIKKTFPGSRLVPIIFKSTNLEKINNLEKGLVQICKVDCLVIASVDFSHYQPALLANLHDLKSLRNLQNLDVKNLLENSEVDSGSSLALLSLWAQDHNTLQFNLQNHTSSDIIYKDPDGEGTSHIFGFYKEGQKIVPEKEISFIIAGDAMFTRGIMYNFGNDFNKAFGNFGDRVFWGQDASILNLEGAITDQKIKFEPHTMNFQFPVTVIKTLQFLHINGVSLANNHSDNAGSNGLAFTKNILEENNIKDFGVAEFQGQGINLAVIGVNLTYPGQRAEPVVDIIKKYKNIDTRIIIMPHWGDEYQPKHNKFQEDSAHLWIDAGADLIIGSHPHVIQDAELYKENPIFYSLGNFVFDQTFSVPTQQGLIVAGKFTEKGIELFVLPHKSINMQPQLMVGAEKSKILNSLYAPFQKYLQTTPAGILIKFPL